MDILHIASGDLWAGAEAQVFYSLKEMKEKTLYHVRAILFNEGELYRRLKNESIDVLVSDENKNNSISICFSLLCELNKYSVDIIHVHDYKSHLLAAAAKIISFSNARIIRTIHGHTDVPFSFKNLKSWAILKVEKLFLRYFSFCLIAVSYDLFCSLKKKKMNSRIVQINNGIPSVENPIFNREVTRKGFNIPDNTLWIGTAARLESIKNIGLLIDAGKILSSEFKDVNFFISIFGDGRLKTYLQTKIDDLDLADKIILHGHNDIILPVLNALDVFTLTSKHEGLPMSLLEAMSFGTIPVCSAVGGMKEAITHNADGFLFESENAFEFAEILADIYLRKDRLAAIRNNAKEKIKKSYSIEESNRKLLALYDEASQGGN